jgi:hypothetical protein
VLAPMLTTPDMWTGFADAYLTELDRIANAERPLTGRRAGRAGQFPQTDPAAALAAARSAASAL